MESVRCELVRNGLPAGMLLLALVAGFLATTVEAQCLVQYDAEIDPPLTIYEATSSVRTVRPED